MNELTISTKPVAKCDYCGRHAFLPPIELGWRLIHETDGPPRGLPAEWWHCQACPPGYATPDQARVRRRFDYVVIDLFLWLPQVETLLDDRLRAIDSAALWLLGDLVTRGVLAKRVRRGTEHWAHPMVLYYDPPAHLDARRFTHSPMVEGPQVKAGATPLEVLDRLRERMTLSAHERRMIGEPRDVAQDIARRALRSALSALVVSFSEHDPECPARAGIPSCAEPCWVAQGCRHAGIDVETVLRAKP